MADATTPVGSRIRAWRQTRGLSQFELASRAGFSVRHVSFIETGRAHPSREAMLALSEVLVLPLREQNRLLEAAGFARVFRETPISADEMAHMRGVMQFILDRHLPYAAVVLDRYWNCLLTNRAASRFLKALTSPGMNGLRNNLLRATFHPEGTSRCIVNWPEVARHLMACICSTRHCTSSGRPSASNSPAQRRSRSAPVQHHHDTVQASGRNVAGTADRDVVPRRSGFRNLLAPAFRGVWRGVVMRVRRADR